MFVFFFRSGDGSCTSKRFNVKAQPRKAISYCVVAIMYFCKALSIAEKKQTKKSIANASKNKCRQMQHKAFAHMTPKQWSRKNYRTTHLLVRSYRFSHDGVVTKQRQT